MDEQYCSREQLAMLIGVLIGDGCISRCGKGYYISITGHISEDVRMFEKLKPILELIRGKATNYRFRRKYGKIEYNFSDKYMFQDLVHQGFLIGKKGSSLDIPEKYRTDNMKHVIAGYFATDGSLVVTDNNGISYPRLEMKSISQILLKSIHDYLAKQGMKGRIYKNEHVPRGQTIYRLQYNGKVNLHLFEEHIGFFNPKHLNKKKRFDAADGS